MQEHFQDLYNSNFYKELCQVKDGKNYLQTLTDLEYQLEEEDKIKYFQSIIQDNSYLIDRKNILLVSPGLGLMGLYCLKVGANKIFIISENERHTFWLNKIFQANGYSNKIEIIQQNQLEQQFSDKADVIIHDCIGSLCVNEPSIKLLIQARNKFMKEDGQVIPDQAQISLVGITDTQFYNDKFSYWENVYGVKMLTMQNAQYKECFFDYVKNDYVFTSKYKLKTFDLNNIQIEDLNYISSYKIQSKENCELSGLVLWTDIIFTKGLKQKTLSSSPLENKENYYQGVFYLRNPFNFEKGDWVKGNFAMMLDKNEKSKLQVKMSVKQDGTGNKSQQYFIVVNQF